MIIQTLTKKRSLGKLRVAAKTKERSPDMTGTLCLQRHTAAAIVTAFDEADHKTDNETHLAVSCCSFVDSAPISSVGFPMKLARRSALKHPAVEPGACRASAPAKIGARAARGTGCTAEWQRGICPAIPYRSNTKDIPAFFPKILYKARARIELDSNRTSSANGSGTLNILWAGKGVEWRLQWIQSTQHRSQKLPVNAVSWRQINRPPSMRSAKPSLPMAHCRLRSNRSLPSRSPM
jgi:hypothetical protein